ncbi:DSD1 family PLP-dependent enzyme [Legionella jordanis]|uniref:Alanine racemase n=1 Tax=Legionella jordanis TaxID=456 RepID=A0A0W0VAX6_9GAMM|nr:DSD1 family PLP-dependent enzyme [Legionella jordanis]KTD16777.1 alanine racemase [Legionella jordanis]RMX03695.1 DSD1 family PLP-dependent enzyme [Legionella jordanis]RMX22243.1 DSD1 family PLP-dependent enzyme [Legionella jordanis]VEH11755.1 alanine racemase [Legionella jordanis]
MTQSFIGVHKLELDTPCLVIDKDKLEYNLNRMRQHSLKHGINVRPHCKTHKSSKLAQLQLKYGAIGICAAKVSEAEVLIRNGVKGVLITSPVVTPYKIERLLHCIQQAPDSMVVVDSPQNVQDMEKAASAFKQIVPVLIDVDPGLGRTGVKAESALELGRRVQSSPWLKLIGIQCYAGNLQHIHDYEERKAKSSEAMLMASKLLRDFKKHNLTCHILTGTGTGTYDIDVEGTAVTEIQPGSYVVMDVEYAAIGSKENNQQFTTFKPALTLLTTVISSNRCEHVTVDAGTKAIYVDNKHRPKIISHQNLTYEWAFGDEHGKITSTGQLPHCGEILELILPHCDPSINLHDKFFITSKDRVVDVWEIDMRGASQ